jgi:4-hydroxy-3-methylbut-2-enyl diphosphate reductase
MAEGTATRAYHIEDGSALSAEGTIRYKPVGREEETTAAGWLPAGPVRIGVTAGASTPNNRIGAVLERILHLRGLTVPEPGTQLGEHPCAPASP